MNSDYKSIIEANVHNPAVKTWKEQGNKVIGTICCYVPEELIHAAGLLPLRVRATGCTDDSQGEAWMSSYSCSFARSCLQLAFDGTYDFLDGVVASDGCLQAQRLYDNWRLSNNGKPFMYLVTAPRVFSDAAVVWYRDELNQMKSELEKFTGNTITDDKLAKSIELYNETRRLIREMYDLQKDEYPLITGFERQTMILAAMSMPKEQYNDFLSQYLEMAKGNNPITNAKARLMLVGSGLDDPAYIKIIEDKGGVVVTDNQCFGSRYLWEPVELQGDLLTSLATSYLEKPTCPRMMDRHQALYDFTTDMVDKFEVDGIIFTTMRNCDPWGGENMFMGNRFKEANIPVLSLEREEIVTNEGQIGVRVEAFIEMLQGEGI